VTISLTHPFVSSVSDEATPTIVRPINWNAEHVLTMTGPALLGRSTASTGNAEELSLGGYLAFDGSTLKVSNYSSVANYQLFTSNGTWTKPSGTTFVYVRVCGGGQGGTGGLGPVIFPASGGYPGTLAQFFILASSLSGTASVVVGAKGNGGAVKQGGSLGGSASFGSYYSSRTLYYHGRGGNPVGNFTGIFNGAGVNKRSVSPGQSPYNSSLAPAVGGSGGFTDPNDFNYYSGTRGGVGFASLIAAAVAVSQTGENASLQGTAVGTNASVRGYGGGGSNSSAQNGGQGYLGGGGGGGYSDINDVLNTVGGDGGNGFVEVFSW